MTKRVYKDDYRWKRETARKIRIVRELGGKCEHCGLDGIKYPWLIDLHHKDPTQKEIEPNKLYDCRFKDAMIEAAKCILLCGNCHRTEHNKQYHYRYVKYEKEMELLVNNAHIDYEEEHKRIEKERLTIIKKLLANGATMKIMADECNVSKACIFKMLRKYNLKPNYDPTFLSSKRVTKELFDKIKDLKSQGLTSREISKELGMSKTSVLNHWDRDTY